MYTKNNRAMLQHKSPDVAALLSGYSNTNTNLTLTTTPNLTLT